MCSEWPIWSINHSNIFGILNNFFPIPWGEIQELKRGLKLCVSSHKKYVFIFHFFNPSFIKGEHWCKMIFYPDKKGYILLIFAKQRKIHWLKWKLQIFFWYIKQQFLECLIKTPFFHGCIVIISQRHLLHWGEALNYFLLNWALG